jgi:hypothetical protein
MKKLIFILLLLLSCASLPSHAYSDMFGSLVEWEVYFYEFKISGYPHYNKNLSRYDFYDIEGSYTGSLCYNPLLDKWEYFGL